jgi:hypothetical protein
MGDEVIQKSITVNPDCEIAVQGLIAGADAIKLLEKELRSAAAAQVAHGNKLRAAGFPDQALAYDNRAGLIEARADAFKEAIFILQQNQKL